MDITEVKSFHKKIALTSIGSTIEVLAQHPLQILKYKIQNGMEINIGRMSIRQLYAGVFTNINVSAGLVSSQYLMYDMYSKQVSKIIKNDIANDYLSSFLCGTTLSTIISPLELYTVQKCKNYNIKSMDIMFDIIQKKKFLHGFTMCASREILFSAGLLVINPTLQNYFSQYLNNGCDTIASSIISGAATSIISHPFDTIKSKQQFEYNQSLYNICKNIKTSELFRGCCFRTVRNIGSFFIIMNSNKLLKQYFI
jgi:DNA integrity scanning protein DisA with diadenylate cyclase activity